MRKPSLCSETSHHPSLGLGPGLSPQRQNDGGWHHLRNYHRTEKQSQLSRPVPPLNQGCRAANSPARETARECLGEARAADRPVGERIDNGTIIALDQELTA